ncbi:MAG: GC-type dockerin domain-anchored protein [Phycisphaerales bacterium]
MVVGGRFNAAGGVMAANIAVWSGGEWHAMSGDASGPVHDLCVLDGVLYAVRDELPTGGSTYMSRWDGVAWRRVVGSEASPASRLVVFNGEVIESAWNGVVAYNGVTLRTLQGGTPYVHGGGTLVVQDGSLYLEQGDIRTVSVWTGTAWQALPTTLTGYVFSISNSPVGLMAGGQFNSPFQGIPVIRWNGTAWQTVSTSSQPGVAPSWMATIDSAVYCGQDYSVRMWNGTTWTSPWSSTSGRLSGVRSIGGRLVAMRAVDSSHGDVIGVAARVGDRWENFGSGIRNDSLGFGLRAAATRNGELFVSGRFVQDSPSILAGLARLGGDRWSAVGDVAFASGSVWCMADHGSGLFVGGSFTLPLADGATQNVARWDGERWSALGSGLGIPGDGSYVNSLCSVGEQVYAAGRFATGGTASTQNVALWDGAGWTGLGGGFNGPVGALVWYDGGLVAGGDFTGDNSGNAFSRIARWDGAAWHAMGDGLNGRARFVCVADGSLYVGGDFTLSGTRSVEGVARWDGGAWVPVGEGLWATGEYAWVDSIGVFGDRLVAAGGYAYPGGSVSSRFLREWNGAAWRSLGVAPDGAVNCLHEYGDGLLAMGDFQTADGRVANGCARYERISPASIVRDARVESIYGVGGITYRVNVSGRVRVTGRAQVGIGAVSMYVGERDSPETEYEIPFRFFEERGSVHTYSVWITDSCGTLVGAPVSVRVVPWCSRVDMGSGGGLEGPDGELNNNDFIAFIGLFFRGDLRADIGSADDTNADGVLDNNDFIWFIDGFFQGCP